MEPQQPARRSPVVRFALLTVVLITVAVAGWYFVLRSDPPAPPPVHAGPPADPRLTYPTEFKNVHPSVKYVGDAACATCHQEIDGSYHKHPMGRSAALVGKESPLEKYDATGQNPFDTQSHRLTVLKDGDRMIHRMSGSTPTTTGVPPADLPVDVVIGSGTRGRSYLTIDHGSVWQTGISWFSKDARWNVSPGFDLGKGGKRAIPAECLFCHVNQSDPVAGSSNLYKQAVVGQPHIGCERCHGPGELHARQQADAPSASPDFTIVNPKRLTAELQMDICRQCHLLGEHRVVRRGQNLFDYRPGLPLELYLNAYVRRPDLADNQKSVGQFEQMGRSACFNKSNGVMTCTSCHDPHVSPEPAAKAAFYRGKCLTCHTSRGCSEPEPARKAKNDSCVACHMPERDSSNIAHASVTDHRILRRPDKPPPPPLPTADQLTIVPYFSGPTLPAEERNRDEGIALYQHLLKLPPTAPAVGPTAAVALARLQEAVAKFPTDHAAWVSLSGVAGHFRQPQLQADAARKAAELQPDSEAVRLARAAAELRVGEYQTAQKLADELIAQNPASVEYRQLRATAQIARRDWIGAEATCREAIALNPMAAEAHVVLAMALNGQGKRAEADKAAEIGLALTTNPADQKQFREWLRR